MRDPEKAQRLMKERIEKLDGEIEIARKRVEEERVISAEAKKNEAIERVKAENEMMKAQDEKRKADDEMKMRLVAEAQAEVLQKELAEMRAKVNAMSALEFKFCFYVLLCLPFVLSYVPLGSGSCHRTNWQILFSCKSSW